MKINPLDIRTFPSFLKYKKRFLSHFPKDYHLKENEDTCWEWQGPKYPVNYGQTTWGCEHYPTHRMSYIIFNGLIPNDKIVRHTCDNRRCVNPKHLISGTFLDNAIDNVKRNRQGVQKLTQEDVIEIKTALKNPSRGLRQQLAEKYNVAYVTISHIKNNISWSWLKV